MEFKSPKCKCSFGILTVKGAGHFDNFVFINCNSILIMYLLFLLDGVGGVELIICLQTWEFDKPRKSKHLSSIMLAVIVESIAT